MTTANILYICPSTGIGGAETFLKNTWLGHNKLKFNAHYLLFSEGPLGDWLKAHHAPVYFLKKRPRISQPWTWFATHQEISEIIRLRNIHLVHSTMAYGALFSAFAAGANSHHVWFQHGPVSGWMDCVAALLPHQRVFTNSEATTQAQKHIEKYLTLLIPDRPLQKVNLGVEAADFPTAAIAGFREQLIWKHKLTPDTFLISMACRIQEWKGVHHLIEAVKFLQSKASNKKFHAFIWGEAFHGDEYLIEMKKRAERLPISFEGATENVRLAIAASDVIVNASVQPEPFGLTLIEGMSSGTVPLAPAWGGPTEFITSGQNGLLYRPQDPVDLARQLNKLITEPELHLQLKAAALATYKDHFTVRAMMNEIEIAYSEITAIR